MTSSKTASTAQAPLAGKIAALNKAKRRKAAARKAERHNNKSTTITRAQARTGLAPLLLDHHQVVALVGFSYQTIWAWMRAGKFPRSRAHGGGSCKSVWLRTEIEQWLANLPVRRLKGDPSPEQTGDERATAAR
jgi:predicted DNA-binding transcriptional regulator AlpA